MLKLANFGCLPFGKKFPEDPAGNKWNTTVRVVPVENSREQQNVWKGSPVSQVGMFQTEIRVPFVFFKAIMIWYHFQPFAGVFRLMKLINANGKRDSWELI